MKRNFTLWPQSSCLLVAFRNIGTVISSEVLYERSSLLFGENMKTSQSHFLHPVDNRCSQNAQAIY